MQRVVYKVSVQRCRSIKVDELKEVECRLASVKEELQEFESEYEAAKEQFSKALARVPPPCAASTDAGGSLKSSRTGWTAC